MVGDSLVVFIIGTCKQAQAVPATEATAAKPTPLSTTTIATTGAASGKSNSAKTTTTAFCCKRSQQCQKRERVSED